MNRREFLWGSALLAAALQLPAGAARPRDPRMLVMLHLFGGNDGLNTVIPYTDPLYKKLRPGLSQVASRSLTLGSGLALHGALQPLLPLWKAGQLAIVNGVGSPEPTHSHFQSADRWHSGSAQPVDDGWLGRALHRNGGTGANVDPVLSRALWGAESNCLCARPESKQPPGMEELSAGVRARLDRLYGGRSDTLGQAHSALLQVERARPKCPGQEVQAGPLGESLATVLSLMPQARVYHCSMTGFDTHAEQLGHHEEKLKQLGEGLAWFWQQVEKRGWASRTTVCVYSEFGRRVEENGSAGTDHGTAGPVLLLGGAVRGGLHGLYPSLSRLEEGDLVHNVDFRSVYATLLEDWLEVPSGPLLGARYERLRLF